MHPKEAGSDGEDNKVGESDEDHQWPDVEENSDHLRVWVGGLFRSQDEVGPGKEPQAPSTRVHLDAPQERESTDITRDMTWM